MTARHWRIVETAVESALRAHVSLAGSGEVATATLTFADVEIDADAEAHADLELRADDARLALDDEVSP